MAAITNFTDFPTESLMQIMTLLHPRDVMSLALTCQRMYATFLGIRDTMGYDLVVNSCHPELVYLVTALHAAITAPWKPPKVYPDMGAVYERHVEEFARTYLEQGREMLVRLQLSFRHAAAIMGFHDDVVRWSDGAIRNCVDSAQTPALVPTRIRQCTKALYTYEIVSQVLHTVPHNAVYFDASWYSFWRRFSNDETVQVRIAHERMTRYIYAVQNGIQPRYPPSVRDRNIHLLFDPYYSRVVLYHGVRIVFTNSPMVLSPTIPLGIRQLSFAMW